MSPDSHAPAGELTPSDYVLHLWRRSGLILILCAVAFVLTYLGMRFLHGEVFETRAQMMVRAQPRLSNVENEELGISPPSFELLFTSDETITFVRNQYNDMVERGVFPPEAKHMRLTAPLEKIRGRFQTETAANVDTTITTKFSPVVEFKCLGETRDQALVLMELWLSYCLRTYGNLNNDEAEVLLSSLEVTSSRLKQDLETVVAQRDALARQRQLVETKIASNYRILTSAPMAVDSLLIGNDIMPFSMDSGPARNNFTVEQGTTTEPGLWERIAEAKMQLAKPDEETPERSALRLEVQQMELLADSTVAEVQDLASQARDLARQIASLEVRLNQLQYAIRLNSNQLAYAVALIRPIPESSPALNPEANILSAESQSFGTLRVMTKPVLPTLRESPQRTLIAAITAFGMLFVLVLLAAMECYLRHALRNEAARKQGA